MKISVSIEESDLHVEVSQKALDALLFGVNCPPGDDARVVGALCAALLTVMQKCAATSSMRRSKEAAAAMEYVEMAHLRALKTLSIKEAVRV